jgi:hypothetical protein
MADPEIWKCSSEVRRINPLGLCSPEQLNAISGTFPSRDFTQDHFIRRFYSVIELAEGRLPWLSGHDTLITHRKKVPLPDITLLMALPDSVAESAAYFKTFCEQTRRWRYGGCKHEIFLI